MNIIYRANNGNGRKIATLPSISEICSRPSRRRRRPAKGVIARKDPWPGGNFGLCQIDETDFHGPFQEFVNVCFVTTPFLCLDSLNSYFGGKRGDEEIGSQSEAKNQPDTPDRDERPVDGQHQ